MSDTGEKARSLFDGERPYHADALRALPVLVRQARARETIQYGVIADEIGVHGARNMAYPLGCIGKTLLELGDRWRERIPPLEAIVVNKRDGLPGVGVAHFLPDPRAFATASRSEKRLIVREVLRDVFEYAEWDRVLFTLGLEPIPTPELPTGRIRAEGGEGAEHRALKEFIAANPHVVGADGMTGEVEQRLTSGDLVDVLLRGRARVLAVEVKGVSSAPEDVFRGIFQAVKYEAVLDAESKVRGTRDRVGSLPALEGC